MQRLLSAGGLGCPHVAVVDVGLQIALGEVGAFASRNNAAHVEGTTVTLLDALDRVGAVVQGQTWAHFISLLLVKQCTLVTEYVFAGNHSSIEVDWKSTFVTEVYRYFITLPNQIQLEVPEHCLWESPLTTVKPVLLLEAKVIIFPGVIFHRPARGSLDTGRWFISQRLLGKELYGDASADIWAAQSPGAIA